MKLYSKFIIPAAVAVLLAGMALNPVPVYLGSTTLTTASRLLVKWVDGQTANPAVKFDTASLDPLQDIDPLTGPGHDPFYRYFLDLGDGQYKMGDDISDLSTFQYVYASQGNKVPYLELAYAYDKDKKKKQNLAMLGPDGSVGTNDGMLDQVPFGYNRSGTPTTMPLATIPTSTNILLKTTQAAVQGVFFTTVITYQCPNALLNKTLKMKVDVTGMTLATPRLYNGETVSGTPATTNIEFVIPKFKSASSQRNLILMGYIDNPPYPDFPALSVKASLGDSATNVFGPEQDLSQPIVDSHDPNSKATVFFEKVCQSNDRIEYVVYFQNDGIAPVQTVVVKDELDSLLKFPKQVAITGKDIKLPDPTVWTDDVHRELVFTFNPANLKGSGHPDYGVQYGYESTVAWFRFRVWVRQTKNCNAICNNARIFFDKNTPVETGTILTPIACTACSGCDQIDSTMQNWPPIADTSHFSAAFPVFYNDILNDGFTDFKWYPSEFVTNWNQLNTQFTAQRPMVYTLVASKNCKRVVFSFFMDKFCFNLNNTLPVIACSDGLTTVDANVTGAATGSVQSNWVWSNGTTNASATTYLNLPAGNHYIGITDTLSGCSKEIKINVAAPVPIYIQDDPTDCWAKLFVSGGTPGYSFQWNVNGVTSSSTAGKKALRGITSYTVTVTDAQGCTAVFNGRGNPVCPRVPLSDYQLALLAGSLAVAAGFAVRKLMKK